MDNLIKLTALYSQPLTPPAQLFSGFQNLLRACLSLDGRIPRSCRKKCLWLIKAIFLELWGSWYSSISALIVWNQSLSKCCIWEGSSGRVGTTQCPVATSLQPVTLDIGISCCFPFTSSSPWTHMEGHCTSWFIIDLSSSQSSEQGLGPRQTVWPI